MTAAVLNSPEVYPVALCVCIVVCTWLLNCTVLGGILQVLNQSPLAPAVYFFLGSQAVAALLHVTLNLPPAVVSFLFGHSPVTAYVRIFCLFSVYLETLFCNLALLHAFCGGLDTFLRLRSPPTYLQATQRRHASAWLKLGAPWLVAAMQAVGQLAISNRQATCTPTTALDRRSMGRGGRNATAKGDGGGGSMGSSICVLADPNFLIIRTCIAYVLPLVACLAIAGLQIRLLRRLPQLSRSDIRALLATRLSSGLSSGQAKAAQTMLLMHSHHHHEQQQHHQQQQGQLRASHLHDFRVSKSPPLGIKRDFTKETLISNLDTNGEMKLHSVHNCPRHGAIEVSGGGKSPVNAGGMDQSESKHPSPPNSSGEEGKDAGEEVDTAVHLQHQQRQPFERLGAAQADSSTTTSHSPLPANGLVNSHQPLLQQHHTFLKPPEPLWLKVYKGEQLSLAINLLSSIIAIASWSPLILTSLAYGLCSSISPSAGQSVTSTAVSNAAPKCFVQITASQLALFRWWSYASSGLFLPSVVLAVDKHLRKGCMDALSCCATSEPINATHTVISTSKVDGMLPPPSNGHPIALQKQPDKSSSREKSRATPQVKDTMITSTESAVVNVKQENGDVSTNESVWQTNHV